MILISGATGNVGSALVPALRDSGQQFRALAHSDSAAAALHSDGVDVARGDLTDGAGVSAAFEGVETAFLLTPLHPAQVAMERTFVDAAAAAGVGHIVKVSVLGLETPDYSDILRRHVEAEAYLKESGVRHTILRPNIFMQNVVGLYAAGIAADGRISQNAGAGVISWIDIRDIAASAVAVLAQPDQHEQAVYELTGPEALSFEQLARLIATVLERDVAYVPVSDDDVRSGLLDSGAPEWLADDLTGLFAFHRDSRAARVTDHVLQLTGHAPRGLEDLIREQRASFDS